MNDKLTIAEDCSASLTKSAGHQDKGFVHGRYHAELYDAAGERVQQSLKQLATALAERQPIVEDDGEGDRG